jgi:hypothetical protein
MGKQHQVKRIGLRLPTRECVFVFSCESLCVSVGLKGVRNVILVVEHLSLYRLTGELVAE